MYGLGGLSAEVCKNLCLAGISATIVDAESVTTEDLSSNFFLSLEDVGTNRVVAALPRIKVRFAFVGVPAACALSNPTFLRFSAADRRS